MKKELAISVKGNLGSLIYHGQKTMTRRALNPQPSGHQWECLPGYKLTLSRVIEFSGGICGVRFYHSIPQNPETDVEPWIICKYGKKGDRLWVREPAKVIGHEIEYHNSAVTYQFEDGMRGRCMVPERLLNQHGAPPNWVYKCQGVPNGCIREMARSIIEITAIRVERLQDITEADAKAEGASFHDGREIGHSGYRHDINCGFVYKTARESFKTLWQHLNGPDSWDTNPWVWVVEFKKLEVV